MPTFLPSNEREILWFLFLLSLVIIGFFVTPFFKKKEEMKPEPQYEPQPTFIASHADWERVADRIFLEMREMKDMVFKNHTDLQTSLGENRTAVSVNIETTKGLISLVKEIQTDNNEMRTRLQKVELNCEFVQKGKVEKEKAAARKYAYQNKNKAV